jgi:hypothetical protein
VRDRSLDWCAMSTASAPDRPALLRLDLVLNWSSVGVADRLAAAPANARWLLIELGRRSLSHELNAPTPPPGENRPLRPSGIGGCCAGHALRASGLSACRWKPEGLAGAVVPALVFPAVDLARAVALVFRAVGFQPVNHFSFGQVLGYLLGHALPRS